MNHGSQLLILESCNPNEPSASMARLRHAYRPLVNKILGTALCALIGTALAPMSPATAKSWPDRQIELVVPFSPGGSTDAMARLAAPRLSEILGVSVVVLNKPGAGGAIGTSYMLAQPDGYRISTAGNSNLGPILVHESGQANYTLDDIATLGMSTTNTLALVSAPGRYAGFEGFLKELKEKPAESVSMASWGPKSPSHFYIELLAQQLGAKVLHVPFEGGNNAMLGAMGNHVDVAVVTAATALPSVRSGKLEVLAVTSAERASDLPDVPSIKELGYPDAVYVSFDGFATSSKVPADRLQILRSAMAKVLQDPEYQQAIKKLGADPKFLSGEQYDAFVRENLEKLRNVAAIAGIKE